MISAIEWNGHTGRMGGAVAGALDPAVVGGEAGNDLLEDIRGATETLKKASYPPSSMAFFNGRMYGEADKDFDAHREWRAITAKQDRERDERFFPGLNGEGDAT